MELVYEQKEGFITKDPTVYLISYLRDDIIKYVKNNPYQYVVKMQPKLYTLLLDETRNPLGYRIRILDVLIVPNDNIDKGYTIYKSKNLDYPNLEKWWEYLPLEKKANIYLKNKYK